MQRGGKGKERPALDGSDYHLGEKMRHTSPLRGGRVTSASGPTKGKGWSADLGPLNLMFRVPWSLRLALEARVASKHAWRSVQVVVLKWLFSENSASKVQSIHPGLSWVRAEPKQCHLARQPALS